ncbi:hypothetical protein J7E73_29250 [Paenibacillus albidus]|uniref:hypothetical protein n=1 Tax=Paenibacillus albidus TaxID=2041023 RepID=UPI001BE65AA5|nr:hypothetical protein [Paenibacillus albidus]MBT2293129.1 hypothetical protein [Paenibacillus albidus]
MSENQCLYAIALIDHNAGSQTYCYAIVAPDQVKAGDAALQKHALENEAPMEELEIDADLCYEITCAPDAQGNLFYIELTHSA